MRFFSQNRSLFLIGLALILFTACGEQPVSSPPSTAASTPASVPAAPIPTKDVHAVAMIGMNITDFTGVYGAPTKSDVQGGTYTYTAPEGTLDVTVRTKEPGHNLVLSTLYTPKNTWTVEQATAQCLALAPHDVKLLKTQPFSSGGVVGVQLVYQSAQLAALVPKDEFVDGNLNPTAPGTFGVVLSDDATNQSAIASCSTQIGLQVV